MGNDETKFFNRPDHWRICGGFVVRMHCWDGDYVVYNPFSGQTHRLDIVSGRLLQWLNTGPKTFGTLCRDVETFLELDDQTLTKATVGRILESLSDAGLVEAQGDFDGRTS